MKNILSIIVIALLCVVCQNVFGQNKSKKPKKTIKPTVISCGVCGKAISTPSPKYPVTAKAVKASGAVNVQILIDEKGNVIKAKAISGHPLLRAEAIKAALKAKFKPFTLSEKAVQMRTTIVYNFVGENSVAPTNN